jgi:cyclophilin family peptidyl-prolyl cis-trans isomerase
MSRSLIRSSLAILALLTASLAFAGKPADAAAKGADKAPAAAAEKPVEPPPSRVRVDTNLGSFTIQLELSRAPLTVANFVQYMRDGHYNGLIFHRVVSNFIVQAGGFDKAMNQRSAVRTVANESGNGLSNKRGTVGLARTDVDGFDVVERIGKVPTGSGGAFGKDVPLEPIVIEAITPVP